MDRWLLLLLLLAGIFFLRNTLFDNRKSQDYKMPEDYELTESELIEKVKAAINPKFQDWVLFENGTYIILDSLDTDDKIRNIALERMSKYGPVHVGGSAGDFGVSELIEIEGWSISSHSYGMYTYVHPSELDTDSPSEIEIGFFGRNKRNLDGENPIIIHVNTSQY